jgi:hypothetical protein
MTKEQKEKAIIILDHDNRTCPICCARRKTKRANQRAKAIRSAYADCGMTRVRGNLGGIYYE